MRFSEIQIPCEEFRLENGLTLLVHEDHKTPIVAVNIWYHVGSKNEKPGKTGFAHLFEHHVWRQRAFTGQLYRSARKSGRYGFERDYERGPHELLSKCSD